MTGAGPFYQPRSVAGQIDDSVRLDQSPGGVPAPTGYYPNMSGVEQGRVITTPIQNVNPVYDPESLAYTMQVDQHPWLQVSASWTPGPSGENGRQDGHHDPLTDGPPIPVVWNSPGLFFQRAQGTSRTQFDDVPGRSFPKVGSQDGSSWTYYQNTAAALAPPPTGVRPNAGLAYNPDDPEGNTRAPDTLWSLPPAPAHGWTSIPVVNAQQELVDKAAKLKQQRPARRDLLSNSRAAGQTFTQSASHLPNATPGTGSWRSRG